VTGHEKGQNLVAGASSLDPQFFDLIRDLVLPFIMMIWVNRHVLKPGTPERGNAGTLERQNAGILKRGTPEY